MDGNHEAKKLEGFGGYSRQRKLYGQKHKDTALWGPVSAGIQNEDAIPGAFGPRGAAMQWPQRKALCVLEAPSRWRVHHPWYTQQILDGIQTNTYCI